MTLTLGILNVPHVSPASRRDSLKKMAFETAPTETIGLPLAEFDWCLT